MTTKVTTTKKLALKKPSTSTKQVPAPSKGHGPVLSRLRKVPVDPNHGFRPNTDRAKVAAAYVEGGVSRSEINNALREGLGETSNGSPKNVDLLGSQVLAELKARGYTVESSWRVVPPVLYQEF